MVRFLMKQTLLYEFRKLPVRHKLHFSDNRKDHKTQKILVRVQSGLILLLRWIDTIHLSYEDCP